MAYSIDALREKIVDFLRHHLPAGIVPTVHINPDPATGSVKVEVGLPPHHNSAPVEGELWVASAAGPIALRPDQVTPVRQAHTKPNHAEQAWGFMVGEPVCYADNGGWRRGRITGADQYLSIEDFMGNMGRCYTLLDQVKGEVLSIPKLLRLGRASWCTVHAERGSAKCWDGKLFEINTHDAVISMAAQMNGIPYTLMGFQCDKDMVRVPWDLVGIEITPEFLDAYARTKTDVVPALMPESVEVKTTWDQVKDLPIDHKYAASIRDNAHAMMEPNVTPGVRVRRTVTVGSGVWMAGTEGVVLEESKRLYAGAPPKGTVPNLTPKH